jgi:acetyl esterase
MTAMPVHPQVQPLLDAIAAADGPSLAEMGPEAARVAYRSTFTMVPGDDVALVEDVSIPAPDGAIPARRYVPSGAPDPAPCLLWFHGGGWVLGDLETADATARGIAVRADAVVVSVDYRRAPEHPFPAANEDALTALRWVHAEAATLGLDPARVAVGGDSAGGNLAAVLAQRWSADDGPPLCQQVLVYPVVDLTMSQPSYVENAEGYFLTRATMQWFIESYAAPEPKDPGCSPLHADDLSGLPPAFILTAEFDPLRDEGDLYAARLAEAGVDVEHVRYPGQVHPFVGLLGMVDDAADALDRIGARLRAAFG